MARFFRPHTRRTAPLILLASLAIGIPAARAAEVVSYPKCDREPTESDVSAAKGAFEAGQVSFQEADYERAILYWEDAFRRDCTAAPLLLNLSRAYELSGQKKSAIIALETFLERRPNHDDRPSIEKRIAVLKKSVAEEPVAPAPTTSEPTTTTPAKPAEDDQVEDSGPRKPVWPIIVTGIGVSGTLVGLAIWGAGQQAIDKCPLENGTRVCSGPDAAKLAQDGRDAEGARNFGVALTLAGAATAITGGVFWIVTWSQGNDGKTASAKKTPAFVPVASPEFTGFSYSGSF